MNDFRILSNGRLRDATIQNTLDQLEEDVPDLDSLSAEANMTLFRTYAAFAAAVASRYEDLGLSHARFNVLRWLYHADDHRLTMTDLGARLEASIPNAIRMVQALEAEGWVRRINDTQDRRVRFVELTEEGTARFRLVLPKALTIWEEVWSGISAEETEFLIHLLSKFRVSLLSRYMAQQDVVAFRLETQRRNRRKRRARE